MGFWKTAKIPLEWIAEAEYDADSQSLRFLKNASKESHYKEAAKGSIKIQDILNITADKYNISNNPKDYLYEVVRAVTAEVPNENGDAFPRNELLRFDHQRNAAVFQTFIGKPHHINHKADNPKTARGVVIDAYYNDKSPPLEQCPSCGTKTAARENRDDETGIYCKKCGTVVKDEFVELLLAIDTKKDPTFAHGVKTGALDGLSMGCTAGYTDCSICGNRARSASQFCEHIRGSNKKKQYKTASGSMKMSFEKCGEVEFTEISRVDQPADPTARQKELLEVAPASLQLESENLILANRISKLEAAVAKYAQAVGAGAEPTDKEDILNELESIKDMHPALYLKLKQKLDPNYTNGAMSIDEYTEKKLDSQGDVSPAEIGILSDTASPAPAEVARSAVLKNIEADIDKIEEQTVGTNLMFKNAYNDVEVTVTNAGNVTVGTKRGSLFLIRPKDKPTDRESAKKIAVEVLTSIASRGLVETMEKYNAIASPRIGQVLEFHVEDFAGGRSEGDKKPSIEGGDDDMSGDMRGKPAGSTLDDEHSDRAEKRKKRDLSDSTLDDAVRDNAEQPTGMKPLAGEEHADNEGHGKAPKSTLEDLHLDFSHSKSKSKTAQMAAEDDIVDSSDLEDEPFELIPDDYDPLSQDGSAELDMQASAREAALGLKVKAAVTDLAKKHVARVEKLYKSRLANIKSEVFESLKSKFARALKLAAKRQALNLESSPMKARMFDVLTSELDLGGDEFYPGMDPVTASTLIEATADGFEATASSMVDRAAELVAMSDEAFDALENDVKHLQPVGISVQALRQAKNEPSQAVRKAAVEGNLPINPSASFSDSDVDDTVPVNNSRRNIRAALGNTMVSRTASKFFNK
jgi:hypothetical protein